MSGTNNSNPLSRLPEPIINAIAVFGIAMGVGFGIGFYQSITASQPTATITEAQYKRIKPGMTLTDVRAIAGDGTEVRSSEDSTVFEWSRADGKTVTGTFEQGKLVEKSQSTRQ